MRVCQVISGDLWAGAEVMYYRLLGRLRNFKDMDLLSILLNDGKLAFEVRKLGIPVIVVDENKLKFSQMVRNTRKIMKQFSPEIIHSHRLKENILSYLSVRPYKQNISLISTIHGMGEPTNNKYDEIKQGILLRYNNLILKRYYRYVVAVSDDMRNKIIMEYHIPQNKMLTIHNGTDLCTRYSFKDRNYFVIGSAGRLFPIKNYPLMVDIARELRNKTERIRFLLVGEGPEKERIIDMITKYQLGDVFKVKGFVENMESFFQEIDLYLNTSLHEGLPMSILEAMSYGLPIVAPNIGGIREIFVDELKEYMLENRNPKDFARKCLELYENKLLRKEIGLSFRDRASSEFSADKMANDYYNIYEKILDDCIIQNWMDK